MLIQDKFPLQCGSPQTRAAVNRAREYRASSPVTFGHSGLNGSAVPDKTHMGTDSPPPCATTVSTACAVENTHKRWATLCLMKFAVCLPIPYFVNTLTVCSGSNLWNAEGWKAKRDGASLTCNVESFRVWRAWLLLLIGEHVVATSIVTCEELSCRYAAFTHNSQQVWFSYQPQGEQVSGSHRWRRFSPRRALGRRRPCCVGRARPCSGLCL